MTWEPGIPLHPRPRGFDAQYVRSMIALLDDRHDDCVETWGQCDFCDSDEFRGDTGISWSKLFKEERAALRKRVLATEGR